MRPRGAETGSVGQAQRERRDPHRTPPTDLTRPHQWRGARVLRAAPPRDRSRARDSTATCDGLQRQSTRRSAPGRRSQFSGRWGGRMPREYSVSGQHPRARRSRVLPAGGVRQAEAARSRNAGGAILPCVFRPRVLVVRGTRVVSCRGMDAVPIQLLDARGESLLPSISPTRGVTRPRDRYCGRWPAR